MLPQRRTALAALYRWAGTHITMSESLLDSAIMVSRNALLLLDLRDEIVAARRDALGMPRISLSKEPVRRYLVG